VFSLSFSSLFLSLCFANKEKEKGHKKYEFDVLYSFRKVHGKIKKNNRFYLKTTFDLDLKVAIIYCINNYKK